MATITKRLNGDGTTTYKAQVRVDGFPARTATHKTERLAKRWAATIEASMFEGRHFRGAGARTNTLGDAITRFLLEHPGKNAGHLAFWQDRLGTQKLHMITADTIAEVRGELARGKFQRARPDAKRTSHKRGDAVRQFQRSGSTVNRYLASLSKLYSVMRKEWRWVSGNPVLDVSKLASGKARDKVLTDHERASLFKETVKDPVLHAFVVVALSVTARAGELRSLTWRDVDLDEGMLTFRNTKNGTSRSAWLTGEAKKLIDMLAAGPHELDAQVFQNASGRGAAYNYDKLFKAACKAAGITGFVFHGTRHSGATYLARQGATEQQLRAIGGWKSSVVSRYVHLAAHDTREIVAKMNRDFINATSNPNPPDEPA